jgi:hypothetical protein
VEFLTATGGRGGGTGSLGFLHSAVVVGETCSAEGPVLMAKVELPDLLEQLRADDAVSFQALSALVAKAKKDTKNKKAIAEAAAGILTQKLRTYSPSELPKLFQLLEALAPPIEGSGGDAGGVRALFHAAGVMSNLVPLLQSPEEGIHTAAASVIWNMMSKCSDNAAAFVAAGGVASSAALLARSEARSKAASQAAGTIWYTMIALDQSAGAEAADAAVQAGIMPELARLLREGGTTKVIYSAAGALSGLARFKTAADALVAANAVPLLMPVLKSAADSRDRQEKALNALARLVSHGEACKAAVAEAIRQGQLKESDIDAWPNAGTRMVLRDPSYRPALCQLLSSSHRALPHSAFARPCVSQHMPWPWTR